MTFDNENYMIFKGWWCNDNNEDSRDKLLGEDIIRDEKFHNIWLSSIMKNSDPKEIIIVDSASPILPKVGKNEKIIRLSNNFGHSTNHQGHLCGVTRAHLTGVFYALINDYDYCVYLEQDALIVGDGFIDECIKKMNKPYMFGEGAASHATQQSFFIIRKDGYLNFIHNMLRIKSRCNEISPENKFALATSKIWHFFPEWVFKQRGAGYLLSTFKGFDIVPFGYGRERPINWSDQYFYFQHGSKYELDKYMDINNVV